MLTTEHTWNCFYNQHNDQREWYLTTDDTILHIKSVLARHLPTATALSILHSGCGTSDLCVDLSSNKLVDKARVTNTDFSQPVVDIMKIRHPTLHFVREDARSMQFVNCSFHCIVDKGTLDAASSNSTESELNVTQILQEYHRVLIEKGCVVIFSLFGAASWTSMLAPHASLWQEINIYTVTPSTTFDTTPEHVMRTEEVGGEDNATYMIVLLPRRQDNKERRGGGGGEKGTQTLEKQQPWQEEQDTFAATQAREDDCSVDESTVCLKCKTSTAIFECDPCRCLAFCKPCAMKLASGGKCKQCGSFYGGVRMHKK